MESYLSYHTCDGADVKSPVLTSPSNLQATRCFFADFDLLVQLRLQYLPFVRVKRRQRYIEEKIGCRSGGLHRAPARRTWGLSSRHTHRVRTWYLQYPLFTPRHRGLTIIATGPLLLCLNDWSNTFQFIRNVAALEGCRQLLDRIP